MAKVTSILKGIAAGVGAVGVLAAAGAGSLAAARHRVRKTCRPFYADSERQMVIPGLKDGFDPQDLFYVASADLWLFSGYDTKRKNKDVSPLYKVDADGTVSRLIIELPSGVTYKGHGAAVCATDEYVFLTVKDGYVVMSLASVRNAKDGDHIQTFAHVPVELEPAFMNIQDGVLYIGEFYHNFFYNTPQSHWRECPDGTVNPALMYAYDASDGAEALFGFAPRPSRVYSIPAEIQGMCVDGEGRIIMSKSWGFSDSQLLIFEAGTAAPSAAEAQGAPTYLVAGEEVPLFFLYKGTLQKALTIPPMSEGIDTHDGQVWISNESASDIYLLGKLNDGKYVYSLSLEQ